MSAEEVLSALKQEIQKRLPPDIRVSDLEFEGPSLVVYTEDSKKLAENGDIVRFLAKDLRKRIVIRPDPKVLFDPEKSAEKIREMVPPDSGITNFHFDTETGEMVIEAEKPGLVIGRHGSTLREITKEIGWIPRVVRAPPIESTTVRGIRTYLRSVNDERKATLRQIGQKIYRPATARDQWVRVTMLGGCREVGRNSFLLSTAETRILVDCGINVGGGNDGTPYLYVPEVYPINQIDAVVLTHAHLDHIGLVPLLFKYGYDGPIYCTPPTRDLMALLQLDYIEVAARDAKKIPYESAMIREVIKHTITLDYGDVTDIAPDVKLTFSNAGHILGSSVVHFHIGEGMHNIAFTGDFKYEKTLLFDPATNSFPRLETLVMEGTYGGANDMQPSRKEAVACLQEIIQRTLAREGKVLIPTFAVGRSQEVMIVLEELIRDEMIEKVPVYLDGMIYEATAIHTAHPEYLNSELRNLIFHRGMNPFLSDSFVQVEGSSKREQVFNEKKAIILATSGMLNGGPVIEYLKALAHDEKNTLVFVGYQAEGTLGRRIQKGWNEIQMGDNTLKIKMEVATVDGFSGHSDRQQLVDYVRRLSPKPERILTVHGDGSKCIDLASSLYRRFKIETRSPLNLETIRLV
jgi:hypothetical protein